MSVAALYDYQRKATVFSLQKKAAYLAIDMGLGKTLISITYMANVLAKQKMVNAFLVVGPLRTIHSTWPTELDKWRPDLTYAILHGPKKEQELDKKVDVYIINFEGLKWLYNTIYRKAKNNGLKLPFQGVILDEGSMVRDRATQRFKILKVLMGAVDWKLILSGTPAAKTLMHLWTQYYLLDKGVRLERSIGKFREKYCRPIPMGMRTEWEIREDMTHVLYDSIKDITYRLDKKDHLNLPPKVFNNIHLELPKKLFNQYKELEREFFVRLSEDAVVEVFNALALSAKLRQFVQGAMYDPNDIDKPARQRRVFKIHELKLKALENLMEESAGKGILCAIQFVFEIAAIKSKFPDAKVIANGTSTADANTYIKEWNNGNVPLLVCHPQSLAHGVNLQYGSNIILWYGLPWSPEQYLQLIDRLHRNGQKEAVVIHHLLMRRTTDERVASALRLRINNQRKFLQYIKEGVI